MRKRAAILLVIFGLLSAISVSAQSPNGELQDLARRFVPSGMQLAHRVVKGSLATSTSNNSDKVVLLYRKDLNLGTYEGTVLFPKGNNAYDTYELPQPESTWSLMEPMSVFFANVDADPENELFIIDRCLTGIGPEGARYFYRTRVYDWQETKFVTLEAVSEEIGSLRTPATIRKQLPAIMRRSFSMFQQLNVDELNKQLADIPSPNTPLQVVARVIDPFEDMLSRSVTIKADSVGSNDSLRVVISDDGLGDDSVQGIQYRFSLTKRDEGEWRISLASKGWRCQEGRGHQDFSAKPCI